MDPECSLQDVVRCHLCETHDSLLGYCATCKVHLCVSCVAEHVSNGSNKHIIRIPNRTPPTNYPKCQKHLSRQRKLYCDTCDYHICSNCMRSIYHSSNKQLDILGNNENKKEFILNDLNELEKEIYPKFKENLNNIPALEIFFKEYVCSLKVYLENLEKDWHREIHTVITDIKDQIADRYSEHLFDLQKKKEEITSRKAEITQIINTLKNLSESSNMCQVCDYRSKNADFKRFPLELSLSIPFFHPRKINRKELSKSFGQISELSVSTDKNGYSLKTLREKILPIKIRTETPV